MPICQELVSIKKVAQVQDDDEKRSLGEGSCTHLEEETQETISKLLGVALAEKPQEDEPRKPRGP